MSTAYRGRVAGPPRKGICGSGSGGGSRIVPAHERLWRPPAALTYHRAMPQRRLWLAGGEVPSPRGQGQHPIGCQTTAEQYTDPETRFLLKLAYRPHYHAHPTTHLAPLSRAHPAHSDTPPL